MKHVLAGALHEATAKACMAPDRHPARCAVRLKACFLNSTLRFFRDLPALCTGLPPTTILLARLLSGCLPWSLAQRRSGTAENSSLFRLRIHGFHIRAWRLPLGRHCLSRVPNQSQLQSACSGGATALCCLLYMRIEVRHTTRPMWRCCRHWQLMRMLLCQTARQRQTVKQHLQGDWGQGARPRRAIPEPYT